MDNIDEVWNIFESGLSERIMKSDLRECNITNVKRKVQAWKDAGFTIVFTAGVFDIFTINHMLALYHYRILGGNKVKLIVSLDTDKRVKSVKAFTAEKGNSPKPILSWENRAKMIAKQSFGNDMPLVDLIIQHGDDTCNGMHCPHDDNALIAEEITPDVIPVTSSSRGTIKKLKNSKKIAGGSKIIIIEEEKLSYRDILLGEKISTTSIIKRVKSYEN